MNLRLRSLLVALMRSTLLFSAYSPGDTTPSDTPEKAIPIASSTQETSPSPVAPAGALSITSLIDATLPSDPVTLSLEGDTITNATVTGPEGAAEDTFEKDAQTPSKALELNMEYKLAATASDGTTKEASFKTVSPGSAETTFNLPYMDDNLGVGMPTYVKLSRAIPQEYRASIEKYARVIVTPAQERSQGWTSDTELVYRPKEYWKSGTKISLDLKRLGIRATDKTQLKKDSSGAFSVENVPRVVKVDIANYTTTVVENGEVIKTLPSTTGKGGLVTRSGTKLILEKYDSLKMDSDTTAVPSSGSEICNLDAQYATRVTWTGGLIRTTPWSVDPQGKVSISHGCIGLSTDNAGWLYKGTSIDSVVEFTGSDRKMKPSKGMGVWLYLWEGWKALSASGS